MKTKPITELLGKTLTECKRDSNEIYFTTSDGKRYKLYHRDDCCESVTIDDICGELSDLVGSPILVAEENSSNSNPPAHDPNPESFTWTFYKFATQKGYVDVKFYGTSNGYYSEGVDFEEITQQ